MLVSAPTAERLFMVLSFGFHLRPRSSGGELKEVDCVVQTLERFYVQKAILSRYSWKMNVHKLKHNLKIEKPVLKLYEFSSCNPKSISMTSLQKKCSKLHNPSKKSNTRSTQAPYVFSDNSNYPTPRQLWQNTHALFFS